MLTIKFPATETENAHLLGALANVLFDLESGFIANKSANGERRRVKHEKAIRAALTKAGCTISD